jgi:hypothetical protein
MVNEARNAINGQHRRFSTNSVNLRMSALNGPFPKA